MDAPSSPTTKPSLHFQEQGAGDTACLLLHGFGDGIHVWNTFAPSISELCRTVAVDLRGHGDSPWSPLGDYSVDHHLSDMFRLIDALQIDRFVLIGHSLGGELAMRIADARPEKVVGMVIIDFGPNLNPAGVARVLADFKDSIRPWSSWIEYASWLQAHRPLLDPAMPESLARNVLRAHPEGGYRIKCDPALGNIEKLISNDAQLWAILERIVCPALIVRGIGSAVLPLDVAQKMVRVIRRGSLSIVDRAGHAVMTDNPQGFARVLYPYLEQLRTN